MIIDILIVLAFIAMWVYSIRFIFPTRIVSTIPKPKQKVLTPAKVTAVDKDEKKKKDKKPRRICKGWSNHGMLGKRGYS